MSKLKVYTAGPHVFWPKSKQEDFYSVVEELSTRYNFEALVPKDGDVTLPDGEEGNVAKLAMLIYHKNIEDIKQADVIIADITSFRGPSADSGTTYEVGYARALNKPVLMWTDDWQTAKGVKVPLDYSTKVHLMGYEDDGNYIEQFGLADNLMITRPWDLVHVSVEDAFAAAYNLMNS